MINNLDDVKKQIVDVLVREVREHYRDDIAIAACYGSAVTGTANPRSDIDFYFIPVNDRGYRMCIQFIIDDIGYDFWPLLWERTESIASLDQPLASIIADAQVVYHREEADLQRFMGLKQTIEDAVRPENRDALLAKADEILMRTKAQFFDACTCPDDYSKVSAVCSGILEQLVTVTAYANLTYPQKGAANIRNETRRWNRLPVDFVESYERIAMSGDAREIIETTENLIRGTESLLHPAEPVEGPEMTNDSVGGFYEELKSTYNKLISACDARDHIRAYFAANAIARETSV
ncbi:MAG: nucleotidyltransferase domain-containing protein [Armatimonadota bacterium]